jgi:hypothetical protein
LTIIPDEVFFDTLVLVNHAKVIGYIAYLRFSPSKKEN